MDKKMENYSLSDLRAAVGDGENGWGSGWFLIVVLFLFMFGFGGFGWNRQGEFGQYATAASQQEILYGQQFGQLNDRLTNIGNGICNLGYEMQGNIGQLGKEMARLRVRPTPPSCSPPTTFSGSLPIAAAPRSGQSTA